MKQYLIIQCELLNDQYECDADRIPVCICSEKKAKEEYWGREWEWYEIKSDGSLTLVKQYDVVESQNGHWDLDFIEMGYSFTFTNIGELEKDFIQIFGPKDAYILLNRLNKNLSKKTYNTKLKFSDGKGNSGKITMSKIE